MCDNCSIGPVLTKRCGAARADFELLGRVWNHVLLPKAEKSEFLKLLSKLVCCLHIAWLNKAELRRLKIVLERNGRQKKSSILTYRQ